MSTTRRIAVGTAVAAVLTSGLMTGTAQASDSRMGYRECASRVVVNSQTTSNNSLFYVVHWVDYLGARYSSTRWTTAGFHSYRAPVPGGAWQALTQNGVMSSGYATCG